jgi:hypothetical protein
LHHVVTRRTILAHTITIHDKQVAIFAAHDCELWMCSWLIVKEQRTAEPRSWSFLLSHDPQFALHDGTLEPAHSGNFAPVDPGATPTISAHDDRDGIVWTISTRS